MLGTTNTILINAGKSVVEALNQRDYEESIDDLWYIGTLKTVIQGIAASSPDPLSRRHVEQTLLSFARGQYLESYLKSSGTWAYDNDLYEEGLYWFDYIYQHDAFPE